MLGLASSQDLSKWKKEIQERVNQPLQPERIQSLLIILPGASGDVAISTTVIHHIKHINPQCHVTYATKKVNIAIARMCPGVAETIELPNEPVDTLSRRRYLQQFAGYADAVIYPSCVPEDVDLTDKYNLIETLWLLSGLEDGIPQQPQKVWLQAGSNVNSATTLLEKSLAQSKDMMRAAKQKFVPLFTNMAQPSTLRGSGVRKRIQDVRLLMRHRGEVGARLHSVRLQNKHFSRDFVILSTQANSLSGPSNDVTYALIRRLRRDGRTVLHNVLDPCQAAPGSVPLICSYAEFVALREAGIPFVGWRSGLCDIAAAASAPMCILYPEKWLSNDQSPLSIFGFQSMNVDTNCSEFICRNVEDVIRLPLFARSDER